MDFSINPKNYIIFDLDDTLYKEVDFLISAYQYIAERLRPQIGYNIFPEMIDLYYQKASTFDFIKQKYSFEESISDLIHIYRYHIPTIQPAENVIDVLQELKNNSTPIGLITDGRSVTQRNKLKSLGLVQFFDEIIISEEFGSEKPDFKNFNHFPALFGTDSTYSYIGDNFKKDFVAPNQLGWKTIGIKDNGKNIHPQNIDLPLNFFPKFTIDNFSELLKIL